MKNLSKGLNETKSSHLVLKRKRDANTNQLAYNKASESSSSDDESVEAVEEPSSSSETSECEVDSQCEEELSCDEEANTLTKELVLKVHEGKKRMSSIIEDLQKRISNGQLVEQSKSYIRMMSNESKRRPKHRETREVVKEPLDIYPLKQTTNSTKRGSGKEQASADSSSLEITLSHIGVTLNTIVTELKHLRNQLQK
ncbi:hypothetical protein C9374_008386 [Naegleria lovaniensis]|uniref:Uncharacterized protein n=1 Tax=Naegleria lovaniensis TaxID=51637 RepID=A0AA88GGS2_NAELO|nr:uncharacterized protein C9374_008386 [Naegleria lovaniensis]KAG2378243.1 hypothetical protein C9374_008386 [Naegleria lovaniensis]